MAETKKAKNETLPAKTTNESVQTIVIDNDKVISVQELVQNLSKMSVGDKLTGEYWAPEPGESQRVYYIGKAKVKKKNADSSLPEEEQMADAVRLLMEDGETKINGDKVIVSTLSRESIPSAFLIECKGWIEGKGAGRYRDFDINRLN